MSGVPDTGQPYLLLRRAFLDGSAAARPGTPLPGATDPPAPQQLRVGSAQGLRRSSLHPPPRALQRNTW